MLNLKMNKKTQENFNATTLQQSIISKNTSLKGDINSEYAIRIDGEVTGNITVNNKIVIGKDGNVKGTLNAENANIEGTFIGKLILSDTLSLKSTALVDGEFYINKLIVEPGAHFNANCVMGGDLSKTKEPLKKNTPKTKSTNDTALF